MTSRAHRPRCPVKIGYQFGYLYCLLNAWTDDLFGLLLPSMEKVYFAKFLEEFERHLGEEAEPTLVIVDGAGLHQANVLKSDSCLRLEKLPPNAPELNPAERFFEELRGRLANQVFATLEEIEERITQILRGYWKEPQLIKRLTSFPYIVTSNLS